MKTLSIAALALWQDPQLVFDSADASFGYPSLVALSKSKYAEISLNRWLSFTDTLSPTNPSRRNPEVLAQSSRQRLPT